MSAKNVIYLTLSFIFIACLLHSAFFTPVVLYVGSAKIAKFGEIIKCVVNARAGLTVGGLIMTLLSYPVISLLGVVGASFAFGILSVIFVGLTVDYYINLKSFYDKQRVRRQNYVNSESLPSSDTIEGNLAMLGNVGDVVPLKTENSDYESYYNHDLDEQEETVDSILNNDEMEEEETKPRYVSGIDFGAGAGFLHRAQAHHPTDQPAFPLRQRLQV